ncbi:unnamed protein product [Peniophora sp. CBMAI 1063]|nr:unnamed protein product [Peniophora sp. CBMAI 1063]
MISALKAGLHPPHGDPRLKATFGPIRILALDPPREYSVGYASDNDFVLSGKFAHYASRTHCKLYWNGEQMSIMDAQSLNGTWVNWCRLADGETRTLHDQDTVTFTPLPLDGRLNASRDGLEYIDSKPGRRHALAFMYKEHTLDNLPTTLSSPSRALRRSLDELNRIRKAIQGARSLRSRNCATTTTANIQPARTYRGSLDRPERPQTPFYMPPLPVDMTPELRGHKKLRLASFLIPGPEDPDGFPADHPDIIWRRDVSYKHVRGTRAPSFQMQQWSCFYHLPVGLHCDWPLFSSVAYGARPPPDALPPRAQREEAFAKYSWPKDEFTNKNCHRASTIPTRLSPPPSSQHGGDDTRPGLSSHTATNATPEVPPVQRTALASPLTVLPTCTTIRPTLKRSRSPDDATIDRPAKRVAVSPTPSAHPRVLSSPLGTSPCRRSPPSDPHALSTRPVATTPISHTAPDSVLPSRSARARTPSSMGDAPCIPDASGAALVQRSHARKRKREDDADADADASNTEDVEISSAPVAPFAQPDDAPSPVPRPFDGPSDIPQHSISRKRRRIAQPSAPIRRSLRMREKTEMTIRS